MTTDVVTHASPAYSGDAGAPVVAKDHVDGAALRARNHARLTTPSPVTLLQAAPGEGAFELGRRICEAVAPVRPPQTPVLLKPNLGGFDWFKDPKTHDGDDGVHGRTTDPEFVRGVIRCLKARGHTKITVAEGWGAKHADWQRLIEVDGYRAMCAEEGVALVAMDDDGVFDVELDQPGKPVAIDGMAQTHVPTLLMPKLLAEHLDHGLYLSLPKIKAHRFGVMSLSVKGMQGTVMLSDAAPAFRQKWRNHRELNPLLGVKDKTSPEFRAAYVAALEAFSERMLDVLEVEAPDAVLAEGAPAMGGDGFQKLWPSAERVAIGGTNPVQVDVVGARLLGLFDSASLGRELGGYTTSPLLTLGARRFGLDLGKLDVVGDGAPLLGSPRPVHFVSLAGFVLHSDGVPATPIVAPQQKKAAIPRVEPPVAHAVALGADSIVVDGRGSDAAWSRAPVVSWETDWDGNDTGLVTRARFVWSKTALYALFELDSAGLAVDASRPTDVERPKLYEEDCVELFLTPDARVRKHYYEIELGPLGHFFDLDVNLALSGAGRSDATWSSAPTIAATHDAAAHTARIEASFAAPSILRALGEGAKLPLGLFRTEGKTPRRYLAWTPTHTKSPNFHVPEAFGVLLLDP
ncbi:MAG: hypothetical protein NVS3B10_10100 [Polyangiales bacterium]